MFKWKKLGRVFNPQEVTSRSWLKEFSQAPSALIFGEFIRVYFACRPPRDKNGQYLSYSAFVDLDRHNLFKILNICKNPLLELGKLGTFDEFGTYFTSVIRREDDILVYYVGYTRCESVPFNIAIGAAISYDNGETFTKLGDGPILPYNINEPFFLTVPKIRRFNDKWYLWYSAGKKWLENNGKPEPVYKIRMASSRDGINWNRNYQDLIEDKLEQNECQASPAVFFYDNRYHMFFCYRYSVGYRCKERGYRIGYAFSDDMINWIRDDTRVGIDISENGWDSEMVSFPDVFELDESIYMLYLGNQFGRFGFGLARLEDYKF